MKKILNIFVINILFISIFNINPVFAENGKNKNFIKEEIKNIRQDIKNIKHDINDDKKNIRQDQFNIKNLNKGNTANIINGQVTATNGATLTVSKDGKTYTVNTNSKTRLIRHYWGKSYLSDISVNDKINVWGTWTDDTKTAINARLIRDLSITKRFGVFIGTIITKNSDNFVISTINKGTQTVYIISSTKFVNRKEQSIAFSDLSIGDRVRVKGMWDKTTNKITEVSHVKDFSLPIKVSVTPSVTVSPSVSVTPTPTTTITPTVTPTITLTPTPTP